MTANAQAHALPEGIPPIVDNAQGVAGHVPCQVYALSRDGRKFKLGEPVPRMTLETTNKAFAALDALSSRVGGLKRIWVEVCNDAL